MLARGAVHAIAHNSFTVPVKCVGGWGARVHVEMHVCNKRNRPICSRFQAFVIRVHNIQMRLQKLAFNFINQKEKLGKSIFTHRDACFINI